MNCPIFGEAYKYILLTMCTKIIDISIGVITFCSLVVIAIQLCRQKKKDKVELILNLSADFFHNERFKLVFKILDGDSIEECNQAVAAVVSGKNSVTIDGQEIKGIEEVDINAYMNFFNSLAILVEENVVDAQMVMKLFRYQLEKTFASTEMIKYMEVYGFERIKRILPQKFFFYGTLQNKEQRKENKYLQKVYQFLQKDKKKKIKGYVLEKVLTDQEYLGLVKSKNGSTDETRGTLVSITKNASWTTLFTDLDDYEEVGVLYNRCIIQINGRKNYAWVYLKK